jgi:3-oxoacyl-[acyl-carrier protein] reductase
MHMLAALVRERILRAKDMIDPGLEGKVVLVTGANNPHGIGAAVARAFAKQGCKVFLHYLRQAVPGAKGARSAEPTEPGAPFYHAQLAQSADGVLAEIRAAGADAYAWEGDLSNPNSIPELFDQAERFLGPVEILVNNAAHWEADTFVPARAELSNNLVELWSDRPQNIAAAVIDRVLAVNTRAVALAIAEFAARHVQRNARWGRVVNVSTAGAERFPSEVTYGASKFAVESYTRSAASELGKFGITVNAVSLGPVQTGWITQELERELLSTIPIGRVGEPADVADVVLFLASEQARWITGQRIYVGGGHGM